MWGMAAHIVVGAFRMPGLCAQYCGQKVSPPRHRGSTLLPGCIPVFQVCRAGASMGAVVGKRVVVGVVGALISVCSVVQPSSFRLPPRVCLRTCGQAEATNDNMNEAHPSSQIDGLHVKLLRVKGLVLLPPYVALRCVRARRARFEVCGPSQTHDVQSSVRWSPCSHESSIAVEVLHTEAGAGFGGDR